MLYLFTIRYCSILQREMASFISGLRGLLAHIDLAVKSSTGKHLNHEGSSDQYQSKSINTFEMYSALSSKVQSQSSNSEIVDKSRDAPGCVFLYYL